ncbi:MAG: 30S ribosomal protein S7 [Candidatus Blackburnbacteria bacterium RIFCSPHIGHO2_02_FULL_39_13]|uniref:Small ribosomal subunit protein uS7 n=1 Tax=Candidatus Blackburnbacteria bacterium RIFCSPLOWO2_01_FULL_40_20 TaxID=1797519 RepID=A0A1G1VAX1_9BACT|nr:MAG: 30S ribosomal protein S7 [Microgenomates group bacterium GW2011_GWA2_39_19]OGY07884.1 MAG: 30S ribosomal protein S7 [Candidatus Blackburnbacteria bacterium RIFCSPHIGHO2_02_FULL_39_13]OGY12595.1 MAG: 30S ribosomal protein S7 [Candidatus Blackburnbacteria bacterium RIFCSPLOWO2_01_FULL_40_20]OGY14744.1 MAG: 30S ribosomal protein S7 [Candidatus Blackburnbacteria bacterium RIFCSPLOWO2_02_FULL_40_10]HBL52471.1 30S ribosomal protein S7 [Candidatus Blackburnbacteria bacterium]
MRKGQTVLRDVKEDPVYRHKLVTKLINRSMRDGKRSVAQKEVYRAFEAIKQESGEEPLKIFLQAIENIKPNMEVRPRRIGGAAYQVPTPVRGPRKEVLAIRWMIQAANSLPNSQFHTYAEKLKTEILNARKGEGGSMTKRKEVERVAESNKAFSHFRW